MEKKFWFKLPVSLFVMGASLLTSVPSYAVDIMINISGTVYIPPCNINGGNAISVNFGDIAVANVNGVNGAKSTTVPISCSYYRGTPYVQVIATQLTGAPSNVLQASAGSNQNFGIALYMGASVNSSFPLPLNGAGNGFPINQGMTNINNANSNFTFTSVPYKNGTTALATGNFNATATMAITYQ
ncbi:fimbrial protein [Serratia sp. DD3]|uniref:fimbrial protein n=1 Tax=Serratia sp. DD3 TaxID=1410619 RepID=UPI0003C50B3B|nr:fimbrial protein [Serratia sp. DD3]KEY58124.1 minor fimbrial protein PrsF [Serratia sp. DD3]